MRPIAATAALVLVVLACASPPAPSGTARPVATAEAATVVATWFADDGSVVVMNVVAAAHMQARQLPRLARRLRARHPDSRVIVHIFGPTAGPERFVIGHVPSGTAPPVLARRPPSLIATYDFLPMAGR